jgi:hypothetical protein
MLYLQHAARCERKRQSRKKGEEGRRVELKEVEAENQGRGSGVVKRISL